MALHNMTARLSPTGRTFLNKKLYKPQLVRVRTSSTLKPTATLDRQVDKSLQEKTYTPRNHPGRIKANKVIVPQYFVSAVRTMCEDYPIPRLMREAESFYNHLWHRLPPIDPFDLREMRRAVTQQIVETPSRKRQDCNYDNDDEEEKARQSLKDRVDRKLKDTVYNWKPIEYNLYNCLLYLFARFPAEYAVLTRIFKEINERDPDFKPRGFFDFGSGVGSATWVVNQFWSNRVFEYFNVDASRDMNDVAELLQRGGTGTGKLKKGTFYRQFLPATPNEYELVVSAYSLMELPSSKARLQTLLNLWNRTGKYLVLVEMGTAAGFRLIAEARDLILNIKDEENRGHVFSPCPHEHPCPQFLTDERPCNFEVAYQSLPFTNPIKTYYERYSYVVLKKGKRDDSDEQWPRIVRYPLVRSKHTICRMCTKHGTLDEVIFTASKHGKLTYHCARSSDWGDRLPVSIERKPIQEKESNGNDAEQNETDTESKSDKE